MREDQGAGPQLCQPVLYNNSGTMVAAIITSVNTNGTVSLTYFPAGSAAATASNIVQNPNADANAGTWKYPVFL
jgi:hypothetical protein